MAPGTCARVPCILLEEAGAKFETRVIRFMRGEHKSAEFRVINPKGKVPALQIDGINLTENVAIITYLCRRFPQAGLMPDTDTDAGMVLQLADLSYCASTLHPIVTRIRLPVFFATPEAAKAVWEKGCEAMDEHFTYIENRLAQSDWWYGDAWSAMDAYLFWIFWRVAGADYDVSRFPAFADHQTRSASRPAVQRALAREKDAETILEKEGLLFRPPPVS
jgi:glutathione S-transferase